MPSLYNDFKKDKTVKSGEPAGSSLYTDFRKTKDTNAGVIQPAAPSDAVTQAVASVAVDTNKKAIEDTKAKKSIWEPIANTKLFREAADGLEASGESFGTHTAKYIFGGAKGLFDSFTDKLANTKFFKEAAEGVEAMDRGEAEPSALGYLAPELTKNVSEIGQAFSGRGASNILETLVASPINFTSRLIFGKSNPLGDFVGDFAKEMRDTFTTETAKKQAETPFTLGKAADPDFWMTTVAENIPVTLGFLKAAQLPFNAATNATKALMGSSRFAAIASTVAGATAGGVTMRAFESSAEAEETYRQAKTQGMTEKDAIKAGQKVFVDNMALVGLDAVQVALALSPLKMGGGSIMRKILAETAKVGLAGATEGGEEIYQYRSQQMALGRDFSLSDPAAQEAGFIGATMGVLFQVGGRISQEDQEKMKTQYLKDVSKNLPAGSPPPAPPGSSPAEMEKALEQIAETSPASIEAAVQATEQQHQEAVVTAREVTAMAEEIGNVPGVFEETGEEDVVSAIKGAEEVVSRETDMENVPDDVQEILGELSDSKEAMEDWQNNSADQFAEISGKLEDIEKQLKDGVKDKTLKKALEKQADDLSDQLGKMEGDFIAKYEKKAEEIADKRAKQRSIESKVAKTQNAVARANRMESKEAQETLKELEGKPMSEVVKYLNEVDSLLDTTEGEERQSAVTRGNVARDLMNDFWEKNAKTVSEAKGKNNMPLVEVQTVKYDDGTFGSRYEYNFSDRGASTPFGTETFATEEEAIGDVLDRLVPALTRESKESGAVGVQARKALEALKGLQKRAGRDTGKDNGKDNDTGTGVRDDGDSKRGPSGGEESAERGGAGAKRGGRVPSGGRGSRGPSSRKRPSAPVAYVSPSDDLDIEVGKELSTSTTINGFDITRGDFVVFGEYGRLVLFDSVRENGILFQDPGFEDAYVFVGDAESVIIPTRAFVESEYERNETWPFMEDHEERLAKLPEAKTDEELVQELQEESEERQEALDTSPKEIEDLVLEHSTIGDDKQVVAFPEMYTPDELARINTYTGAGGKEKQGAEGRGLLDEYYTPGDVVDMTSALLGNLGIMKDGMEVFEPAAGIGAFLHGLPDPVENGTRATAYEINETAARILKINHPMTVVYNRPFEDIFITDRGKAKGNLPQYDLVIGNPPYGTHRGKYKGLGEEPKIERYEEYFIKRSLDITKKGGHIAMVVPSSFLRSGESNTKIAIGSSGVLVAAYRLPNGAFPTTDIGTDIIVMRKRDPEKDMTDVSSLVNDNYFKDPANTEKILGEEKKRKGKFGMETYVQGDLDGAAEKFYESIGQDYAETETTDTDEQIAVQDDVRDAYKPDVLKKERAKGPKMTPAYAEGAEVTFNDKQWTIKSVLPMKSDVKYELVPKEGGAALWTNEAGLDSAKTAKATQKNAKAVSKGGKTTKLLKLEKYSTADEKEATLWTHVQPTGELSNDAPTEGTFFFRGKRYNRFNYLQGDIYEKLDQLEEDKATVGDAYEAQKEALLGVLPPKVTVDRMSVTPNSRFAEDVKISIDGNELSLAEHFLSWIKDLPLQAYGESSRWAIQGYVKNQPVRGGDKAQNESERRTRRREGDRLFKLYLAENLDAKNLKIVEDKYNRAFNAYARPDYRAVPLVGELNSTFKGRDLEIRDIQLQGVGFLVNRGVGLLAHDVGVGKTMQLIIAANETIKRGWAKKPLIVVPSVNVYNQWIKEITDLVPDARINLLANLGGDFKGDIETLEIPEGSISIITEEGFKRLGFKNETYDEMTQDFLDVIENPNEKQTKRAAELARSKAEAEIGKAIAGTGDKRFFEDMGFDLLIGDEIHNANHIIARAKVEEGKVSEFRGFQAQPSQFGIKMWLAAQYIQKQNGGRNVYLASATPFTNNPLEYYSVLSLMARERMRRMGILNVNDFMTMFMEISTLHEFKADGSYVEKSEVRSFKNYQQFQKLLTEFIDFRDGVEAGVKRPDRVSKEYVVGETPAQADFKEAAQLLFNDKQGAGTLKAIGEMRAIAFSPFLSRYYTGKAPNAEEFLDGSPKIKMAVELIKQSLKDNPDGGHLIYSTIGVEYFPLIKQGIVNATGLKESEVEIISGATPKSKRSGIQDSFNKGRVKIILGSDAIKEGVNLQENTTDLHILSLPWNFTDLRQVIGRGWRQGNRWARIRINTYFTENSVDVFQSQKLQNKEKRYEESLRFKGDELDVGDIDFEEMKMDLITDPVKRVELEYQFREQELQHEVKRKEADFGYKNRRAAELIEAQKKVEHWRDYVEVKNYEWAEPQFKEAKERLAETRERLKGKGIDVDAMETELSKAQSEVDALKKTIDELQKEKEKAIADAKATRSEIIRSRETDFGSFVRERAEDNQTFYQEVGEKKMLRRGASRLEEWRDSMDRVLTKEEQDAIAITIADVVAGKEIPAEVRKSLESGYGKYLDFMESARKLALSANKDGVPFDLTEEAGEKLIRTLFDEQEVGLLFSKENASIDDTKMAWGTYTPSRAWRNPLIRVVSNAGFVQKKVLYHEAFHAYLDRFVSKEEKEGLLNAIRKNPLTAPKRLLLREGYANDETAEEWLADDFAAYVTGKESVQENKTWYEKLLALIRTWIRKVTGAQQFYDLALARVRPEPRRLSVLQVPDDTAVPEVRMKLRRSINADSETANDLETSRKAALEAIATDPALELNRDLIRKDINTLEDITAQARDIYLKDPNEFEAAKGFETVADERRMKKADLDKYFSRILDPYFKELSQTEREKVNKVLMKGDMEAKDYTADELKAQNLNEKQVEAYKAVRKAFNTAHAYLIGQMRRAGVPEEEVQEFEKQRIGYMPHKWKYRYVVKRQTRESGDKWETEEMSNYKSERLAREAFEKMKTENDDKDVRFVLDTLDNLEVDFFTEQRLSFDALKSVISQAKTGESVKDKMLEALRNMVKEKGFGRNYMRRTGVAGYEQVEVPRLIADYFSGMNGYVTKMEAAKRYYDVLSTIDARRQHRFYGWMRDMIAYDMGNTKEWNAARGIAFVYYLANDISFLLTNATQNFIVGTGELSKYLSGAEKIVGPEMRIVKAMSDWATGNVTVDEKKAITSLLDLGRLGGEMTAEMMGFKNNPLYNEISSVFSKAMYTTTAIVERNVNRVPMFLAARRLFLEQGMSEAEANRKALEVSEDVHFRYGKQHRPRFERGRTGVFFVFYHYMRSLLYQLSRDLSKKEYAAFTRKMLYTLALGGTVSLPFANSLITIWRALFGAGCGVGEQEDCEMAAELSQWEIALTKGIPALTGVDLSGRVGIDLLSVESILQDPNDVRSYIGAFGNLIWINPKDPAQGGRIQQALELARQGRFEDAIGKATPDMFANFFKAYVGYDVGVRSFAGTPLEDANGEVFKYNTWEAIIRATGFVPTRENLLWEAKSKQFLAEDTISASRTRLRRTIQGQVQRGELDAARATQAEAITAGTIDEDTNYVKEFGKDTFIRDALNEWETIDHTGPNLRRLENSIVESVYGDVKPTDVQRFNLRKEFAVYRTFGTTDKLVNDILDESKNDKKVEILVAAKETMGEEAFLEWMKKARKTIKTEADNESHILISDELLELYKKAARTSQ